MKTGWGKLRHE